MIFCSKLYRKRERGKEEGNRKNDEERDVDDEEIRGTNNDKLNTNSVRRRMKGRPAMLDERLSSKNGRKGDLSSWKSEKIHDGLCLPLPLAPPSLILHHTACHNTWTVSFPVLPSVTFRSLFHTYE